jgi:hypothetical protein
MFALLFSDAAVLFINKEDENETIIFSLNNGLHGSDAERLSG